MGCNDPLSTAVREGLALNKVEQETYDAIREPVEKCGFEIVAVEYVKKPDGMNLTIYIDIPRGVTLNDCELVHNTINPIIDELDPVDGPYILNVSSPGLDRPFKKESDYRRNIGKKDMKFNSETPQITVNPETYEVKVDGEHITSKPADKLPLTQLYSLF